MYVDRYQLNYLFSGEIMLFLIAMINIDSRYLHSCSADKKEVYSQYPSTIQTWGLLFTNLHASRISFQIIDPSL